MPVVEVTHSIFGMLGDVAAVADGERILVHVRHVANTGVSTSLLFLLDLTGTVVARQTVPLSSPGGRIELALTGKRSAVLFWKNGLSRRSQSVRLLEFNRLDALPAEPVNFDQPYPEAAVETTRGRLAFSVEFTETPYRWTLRATDF